MRIEELHRSGVDEINVAENGTEAARQCRNARQPWYCKGNVHDVATDDGEQPGRTESLEDRTVSRIPKRCSQAVWRSLHEARARGVKKCATNYLKSGERCR